MTTTFALVGNSLMGFLRCNDLATAPPGPVIYDDHITRPRRPSPAVPTPNVASEPTSLSERAYSAIRRMIIGLELPPGSVIREDVLQDDLGLGRTPIREAIQRLVRDQFVTVLPRRGMYVSGVDVSELATLYETRALIEPYAARLAGVRGSAAQWDAMGAALDRARRSRSASELLDIDRTCHELVWAAADNRFLTDTLDTLYAHSDRLWHLYLADADDMAHAVAEHAEILDALRAGDAERAGALTESHIRSFDEQVRAAVRRQLDPPLASV